MARPERFELPTARFVAEYSIQLSYGRIVCCSRLKPLLHRFGGGEGVRLISVRYDPLKSRNSIPLQGYRAIIVQHSPFQSAGIPYRMWYGMWDKLNWQT